MNAWIKQLNPLKLFVACSAGIFAFAFVAAPHSCEWGLASYFWLGFAAFLILLAAPFVLSGTQSLARRLGMSLGFAALFLGVWVLGIAVANIQILCRLF